MMRSMLCVAMVPMFVGCASIVNGQNQSVSVEARTDAGAVTGAQCKLTNNKGAWFVTTPGSTMIQRSFEDMSVACEKPGVPTGLATVKSSTKAMAFGNIIFGGVIGAGVDVATGAAYDYPPLLTIEMGKTVQLPFGSATAAPAAPAAPASAAK